MRYPLRSGQWFFARWGRAKLQKRKDADAVGIEATIAVFRPLYAKKIFLPIEDC